jgi:MscS family membrane protein
VMVRLSSFGDSSLKIDVQAWFLTSNWDEFLALREDALLRFMDVVESEGSSFALPASTLHVVNPGAAPSFREPPGAREKSSLETRGNT